MRAPALACLLALTALAAPALAGPPRLVKQLEVTTDRDFRLLNPDRYVQVRTERETGAEPDLTLDALLPSVLDLHALEVARLRVDLRALYGERAAMFLDGQALRRNQGGRAFPTFRARLLSYDPERKRCGLLLDNSADGEADGWRNRWLYLPWDPVSGALGKEVVLREDQGGKAERYQRFFVELGPDPSGRHQYFLSMQALPSAEQPDRAAGRLAISRLDLDALALEPVHAFDTPTSNNKNVYQGYRWAFSPDGTWLALAEYSEADLEPIDPPPAVHLVDLAKRGHFSMPVRHTPYGLVFSADNRRLVVASSQDRKLTPYDLEKRVRGKEAGAPSRVHQAALCRDGKSLLLFPRGRAMELRDLVSLKLQRSLPVARLLPGSPALDAERMAVTLDRRYAVVPPADEHGFGHEHGLYVLELP